MRAPRPLASSSACSRAWSDSGEPSAGTRICVYMALPPYQRLASVGRARRGVLDPDQAGSSRTRTPRIRASACGAAVLHAEQGLALGVGLAGPGAAQLLALDPHLDAGLGARGTRNHQLVLGRAGQTRDFGEAGALCGGIAVGRGDAIAGAGAGGRDRKSTL